MSELGSGGMFDQIASRYDVVNRIISFGVDGRWRRATVRALLLEPGQRVLDVATGTGDLALAVAQAEPGVTVVGVDPSLGMLAVAARKLAAEPPEVGARIELCAGDAQALAFPDGSFDAACMAFGIRNVPDRPAALRELARVVRPGGRVAILELGEPREGLLGPLARFHVHRVVPWIGALVSGRPAYRYLERSIAAFPAPGAFAAVMSEAGLLVEEVRPLTFGVCCLYVARAPARRAS